MCNTLKKASLVLYSHNVYQFQLNFKGLKDCEYKLISSVQSQKGIIITIQQCSIENQKGDIAVQSP